MKTKPCATLLLALALCSRALCQDTTPPATPEASATPVAPVNLEANDTARFLAGLPPSPGSPLEELTKEASWQEHAKFFNSAWASLDQNQLAKIRAWDASYIPDASTSKAPVFYMFSGPDYLYVDTFFPNGSTYVLCGIEPIGPVPDVTKIRPGSLSPELHNLEASLNSVLSFSFFITKEMKSDLQNHTLNGTLPLIYIFLARSGKMIHEVSFVGLDSTGALQPMEGGASAAKGLAPGVKITFSRTGASEPQTLYYFSTDISDDGIKKSGFLKFCQSLAPGNSFVKSASYLMHESYFSTIRSFLLNNSLTLVQDDSGIPISFFTPDKWQVRYFGSYPGPIPIFKKYLQPLLYTQYQKSNPVPLPFGIGYRHYARESTLILGTRKVDAVATPPAVPAAAPSASPAPAAAPQASLPTGVLRVSNREFLGYNPTMESENPTHE